MDTAFFLLSKLVGAFIALDTLVLVSIVFAWAAVWRGKVRVAKWTLGLLSAALLALALFPAGEWLYAPLEERFPANPQLPARPDGILVLSGAENETLSARWQQVELTAAAERHLAFLMLARRYPDAKLVFTGGSGSVWPQEGRQADVAKSSFAQQGLDVSRVVFERDARNTFENVMLSRALVHPRRGERWILITSAAHMPRSVGIFCKAGWPVIPYPVDHRTLPNDMYRVGLGFANHLNLLNAAIKEWVGLAAYYVTGKTSSLFPAGCE